MIAPCRRIVIALSVAAFLAAAARAPAEAPPAPRTAEGKSAAGRRSAVDEELLKNLGTDDLPALGDVPKPPPAAEQPLPAPRPATKGERTADRLNEELLKGLGEGEDLGAPGPSDPLVRLSSEMRRVEALIAESRSDDETQALQAKIVRDLDELIRQVRKQCQSSSGSGGGRGQRTAQRQPVAQPGQPNEQARAPGGDKPAANSSRQLRRDQAAGPEPVDVRELLKGVWGNLPQHEREQVMQSYVEKFLPKYEAMISDYFRSIADDKRRKP